MLPLLLAAFACDRAGREALAGALVAVAALLKIPLFVLPLSFLLRRRWRALLAFAATVAVLAALSLLLFGFDLHRVWFERCIRPFAEGPLGAYNVQSVDGFLARLMTSGGRQDFSPLAVGAGVPHRAPGAARAAGRNGRRRLLGARVRARRGDAGPRDRADAGARREPHLLDPLLRVPAAAALVRARGLDRPAAKRRLAGARSGGRAARVAAGAGGAGSRGARSCSASIA